MWGLESPKHRAPSFWVVLTCRCAQPKYCLLPNSTHGQVATSMEILKCDRVVVFLLVNPTYLHNCKNHGLLAQQVLKICACMFAMLVGGSACASLSSSLLLKEEEKGEVVECYDSRAYSIVIQYPSIMLNVEPRMSSNYEHVVQSLLNMYYLGVRS